MFFRSVSAQRWHALLASDSISENESILLFLLILNNDFTMSPDETLKRSMKAS